jgi:ankyrin repeat protein
MRAFPESKIAECVWNPWGSHLKDLHKRTCLHYAAQTKDLPPIFDEESDSWDKLLEHFGGEVNAHDKDGRTALSWAAEVGNYHAIRKLLGSSIRSERPSEKHPFYNDVDNDQKSPLFYLLCFRQKDANKDGECPTNDDSDRLLVGSLLWDLDLPDSGRFLLDLENYDYQEEPLDPFYLHPDVLNARIQGRTLFSHAVTRKDYNFVRVLLSVKGIDVTRVDIDGKTGVEGKSPFLHALDNDDERMAKLLNDFWWIDPIGDFQTLFKSFKLQNGLSPVERLQRLLNMELIDLEKALRCSVKVKELSMVQFLLENGASLRPIELKQEWFDLMDSTLHSEDKSGQAKFIELTELTEDGRRTIHVLHAPKEKEDILSKANSRLIRSVLCLLVN